MDNPEINQPGNSVPDSSPASPVMPASTPPVVPTNVTPVVPDSVPPAATISAVPTSTPPAPRPKSKLPIILALLAAVVLFVIGVVIGLVLMNQSKQNNTANNGSTLSAPQQTEQVAETPQEVDSESRRQNKVVYITEGNVWTVNADGSNKEQITKDGSMFAADVYYTAVAWQDEENLSYVKCKTGLCDIYGYDLSTSSEKLIRALGAEMVEALTWSNDGDSIAYYYTVKSGFARKLDIQTGENVKNALSFPQSTLGRDGNVNDGVEITFSNDDKTLLFLNTIRNDIPAANEEPIVIINRDGSIKEQFAGDYTFGTFIGADNVFYKRLTDIDLFSSKTGIVVNDFYGLALDISNDGKNIAYYDYDETTGKTTLSAINVDTKQVTELGDNYSHPRWVNSAEIIANQIKPMPSNEIVRFDRLGLVKVNALTKQVTLLETNPVYRFDVLGD